MSATCEMPLCGSCGADWATGEWTTGCMECGGGALIHPCTVCGGKCGVNYQRDIAQTHAERRAIWTGNCALKD